MVDLRLLQTTDADKQREAERMAETRRIEAYQKQHPWSLVRIRIDTVGPLLGEGVELAVSELLTPVGAGHYGAFGQK
jgi:hypothetical protein